MTTNLLKAIKNISQLDSLELEEMYSGKNRINNIGVALEYFIKDSFCSSLNKLGLANKDRIHSEYFSYLGNQNNPPDFIIKNSDAVEVKKIKGILGDLQLNSSFPKSKLRSNDTKIKHACRVCDSGNWKDKDIIYAVGSVVDSKIKVLWFVYGDCYAADHEVYEKTLETMSSKTSEIDYMEFTNTNEIAVVKRIDPLGITYLRVRGMWGIATPHKVFGDLVEFDKNLEFSIFAIISEHKYLTFPKNDRNETESNKYIKIKDISIKSPNNPAEYIKAKLVCLIK